MTYEQRAAAMSREEIATLLVTHDALRATHDTLCVTHDDMARQLAWFKNQLFGSSSERRPIDPSGRQLYLGEIDGESDVPPPATTVASHQRARHRRVVAVDDAPRFDPSVPVETIHIAAPVPKGEEDNYVVVGEKITERLAQRPASYVVLRHVRSVLKRKCDGAFACAPAPAAVLEKSTADVSLLAGLVIDKFVYHMPLYRQHQRLKAAGVTIGRSTLTNYVQRTAELLEPIYAAQLDSILESNVLAMDETPIKAGPKKNKPPGTRRAMNTGYFWPIYGDRDEVAFPFASTRSHQVVFDTLKTYAGTLLTDGYTAYAKFAKAIDGVVHAQCWAHTRRKFVDAEVAEPTPVAIALRFIRDIYENEATIGEAGLTPEKALAYRREHSVPVVDTFFKWLASERTTHGLLPSNPFTKAIDYTLNREASLRVFLEHPGVPIDTNHLERTIRPIALGRKNWLFCWTEIGAQHAGVFQSLLATCRLHGVNPYTYLIDVLQRAETHPAKAVGELTPRRWKERFAHAPMRSDLDRVGGGAAHERDTSSQSGVEDSGP